MIEHTASAPSASSSPTSVPWRDPLWGGLLVATSALLTASFTCVAPFAAFAVVGAMTMSRRHALGTIVAVWLANQIVGFGVLHYPRTGSTYAWGGAILVAAVLAMLVARSTHHRLSSVRVPGRRIAPFVVAFSVDQLTLYTAAVSFLGGTGAFAPRILAEVLFINAAALVGLIGLHQLVSMATERHRRHRARVAAARFA